jgi:phospho-N-acetylmuramoyl-pentapeptide-transferase
MLYWLLTELNARYAPPGFDVFRFITVRASLAAMTALLIALLVGRRLIRWLQTKQLGEQVREGEDAGVVSHAHKAGTPTMGGLIILLSLLGSALLWADLGNFYVWLAVIATAWMGAVGFADDYVKVIRKDKRGLAPRIKIIGQVGVGLFVGGVLYFHPDTQGIHTLTHLPFFQGGASFDYFFFRDWVGVDIGWLVYIPVVLFIMTAVTNAVNLTDGLDGLCAGVTAFVGIGLVGLAYVSGNARVAGFLDVLYLPGSGELTIFAAALVMACFGFLWYNGFPASVFMGDTGSLALGAAVATLALCVRKELLIPVMGLVFFAETLSVIIQTVYFKYTRRRYGQGRRVFRMAPLHHHFEAGGLHEAKIATRFWIITAIVTIATLLTLRAQ